MGLRTRAQPRRVDASGGERGTVPLSGDVTLNTWPDASDCLRPARDPRLAVTNSPRFPRWPA